MSRMEQPSTNRAASEAWRNVETTADRFARSWQAGDVPQLEAYLPPADHPLHRPTLVRLIALDLDARWRSAQGVLLETYLKRWPELAADRVSMGDLLRAECLARTTYADAPQAEELHERFPEQAAQIDLAAVEAQAVRARQNQSFLGSGRFFVLRQLGQGGMGVVYAALDRERQEVVALKVLPEVEPESLYYFKHEFRYLAEVAHPHLAAPYELLSVRGHWFITMELIEGLSFMAYACGVPRPSVPSRAGELPTASMVEPELTETGLIGDTSSENAAPSTGCLCISYPALTSLLRQLTSAINALHRHGILHRDLKSSNVMIRPDGRLVILDFGLSTRLVTRSPEAIRPLADVLTPRATSTTERVLAGTLEYMSPEQTAGKPLSDASDWYAVGVMLYRVLTGRLPIGGTRSEMFYGKQEVESRDPREFNAEVPEELAQLCVGLLQRDPRQRWTGEQVQRWLDPGGAAECAEPSVAAAPAVPFVGRGDQLAALQQAFTEVQLGATRAVHVFGRSGAGKSRLVGHFLRGLVQRREEVVLLEGRCYESESVPYKALDPVIDALCQLLRSLPQEQALAVLPPDVAALTQVFPVLRRVDAFAAATGQALDACEAGELRRRAFAALRELLFRLSRRFTVVVAIDDLQWGDVDSAAMLTELLRPPDAPRLLLLLIYRSEYRDEVACLKLLAGAESSAAPPTRRRDIELGSLSDQESQQMADSLLRTADRGQQLAGLIARQSHGMPYFILEMADHVRGGADWASWTAAGESVDLDEVLWMRLSQLPPDSRRLLELAAVAGLPLPLRTVLEAGQLTAASHAHVARLRGQHLLRTTGPGLDDHISVYHDRIRETVLGRLPSAELVAHHRRLVTALERLPGADAEQIGVHWLGAGETAKAGHYFAAAAEGADRQLAFSRAARLYEHAVQLLPMPDDERRAMTTKWADALANAGRGIEAARRYQAAAAGAAKSEAFELQRRAAYQYCISGHIDEGRTALQVLLAEIGTSLQPSPTRSLASLLINRGRLYLRGTRHRLRSVERSDPRELHHIDVLWTACAGLSMFDVLAGADFQTRGCLRALNCGEPFRLARAFAWEAAHTSNLGGRTWKQVERLLSMARDLAAGTSQPYAPAWVTLCEGIANFTNGRWQVAQTRLEQAAGALRRDCTGVAWELGTADAFSLWSLMYLGQLGEMHRRAERLVQQAHQRGDLYAVTTHSAFALPVGQLLAGDPDTARQTIAAALANWTQVGFHVQHIVALMAQTYIDLSCGRGEAAWRRMQQQWPLAAQLLRVQVLRSLLTHLRARSALAAARSSRSPGPLLRAARRDAQRVLRERMPYCTPHAQHLLAGVAALQGDQDAAISWLRQAVLGYAAVDMQALAAATRYRLGTLVGGDEGRSLIAEAEAFFQAQGAQEVGRIVDAFAVSV